MNEWKTITFTRGQWQHEVLPQLVFLGFALGLITGVTFTALVLWFRWA